MSSLCSSSTSQAGRPLPQGQATVLRRAQSLSSGVCAHQAKGMIAIARQMLLESPLRVRPDTLSLSKEQTTKGKGLRHRTCLQRHIETKSVTLTARPPAPAPLSAPG